MPNESLRNLKLKVENKDLNAVETFKFRRALRICKLNGKPMEVFVQL